VTRLEAANGCQAGSSHLTADLRWQERDWSYDSSRGEKWTDVRKLERRQCLKNAYHVLLTRARQGMVIFVQPVCEAGSNEDSGVPRRGVRAPDRDRCSLSIQRSLNVRTLEQGLTQLTSHGQRLSLTFPRGPLPHRPMLPFLV
jgi:hypothetical protein